VNPCKHPVFVYKRLCWVSVGQVSLFQFVGVWSDFFEKINSRTIICFCCFVRNLNKIWEFVFATLFGSWENGGEDCAEAAMIRGKKEKEEKIKMKKMSESTWKREELFFFFIKITCWEATVLPNALGSTVASQASPWKMRKLLWHEFCNFFSNFSYFRE